MIFDFLGGGKADRVCLTWTTFLQPMIYNPCHIWDLPRQSGKISDILVKGAAAQMQLWCCFHLVSCVLLWLKIFLEVQSSVFSFQNLNNWQQISKSGLKRVNVLWYIFFVLLKYMKQLVQMRHFITETQRNSLAAAKSWIIIIVQKRRSSHESR